jgi:NADH:ubiquinone oxidoreductase subunit K
MLFVQLRIAGLVIAAATALALLKVVKDTKWKEAAPVEMPVTTNPVGKPYLTDYVLPFELMSVLLLIVLRGAAYIARRRRRRRDMGPIGLTHYLVVAALMFALGVAVVLTRRNAIAVLCGLELMLNGAALNFVAFNRFGSPERMDGQVFTVFIMTLADRRGGDDPRDRPQHLSLHEHRPGRRSRFDEGISGTPAIMDRPILLALLIVALPLGRPSADRDPPCAHLPRDGRLERQTVDGVDVHRPRLRPVAPLHRGAREAERHRTGVLMVSLPWISFGGDVNPVKIDLSILVDNMSLHHARRGDARVVARPPLLVVLHAR